MQQTLSEIHLVFAFFVLLCAVAIGWTQLGRRVMVTVIGIQVLIGVVFAGILGPLLSSVGMRLGEHILGALLAMGAYMAARRLADKNASPVVTLGLSALGLLILLATGYLGYKMANPAA